MREFTGSFKEALREFTGSFKEALGEFQEALPEIRATNNLILKVPEQHSREISLAQDH